MPEAGYGTTYVVTAELVKSPNFEKTFNEIKARLQEIQSVVSALEISPRTQIDKRDVGKVAETITGAIQDNFKKKGIEIDVSSVKRRIGRELSKLSQTISKETAESAEQTESGITGALSKIKKSLSELAKDSKSSFKEATAPVKSFRDEITRASNAVETLRRRLNAVAGAWEVVKVSQEAPKKDLETVAKELKTIGDKKYQEQLVKAAEASRAALLRQKVGTAMRMQALVEPGAPFVVEDWQAWYSYENQLRAAQAQIAQMIAYQRATGQTAYSVIPIYDQLGNKIGQFAVMVDRAGKVITNFERGIGELFEYMFYRMSVWAVATAGVYMFINAVRNAVRYIIEISRNLAFLQVAAEGVDFSGLVSGLQDIVAVYGGEMKEVVNIAYEFTKVLQDQQAALEATRLALIAYNISGLDYREAATLLIGVMKQFGIEADNIKELTNIIDAWALASKRGTVDYKELAQAFNQTAAAAKGAGMDYYQLTALIETLGTATGETGSVLGTFMKFIIEHSRDLEVLLALQRIGIPVVYDTGEFRNVYDILIDLAKNWRNLNEAQKAYITNTWASVRQGPRFKALMDSLSDTLRRNGNEFTLLTEIMNSHGEAEYQNYLMMQTLEGQWRRLGSTWSSFVTALGDTAPFLALRDILSLLNWLLGGISKSGADTFIAALAAAITMFYRRAKANIGPFMSDIKNMVKAFNDASKAIPVALDRMSTSMEAYRNTVVTSTESIIANINSLLSAYQKLAATGEVAEGKTVVPPMPVVTAPVVSTEVSREGVSYHRPLGGTEQTFLRAWESARETWALGASFVPRYEGLSKVLGVTRALGAAFGELFRELNVGLKLGLTGFVSWAKQLLNIKAIWDMLKFSFRSFFVEFLPWFLLWEGVFLAYEKGSKAIAKWRESMAEAARNTKAFAESENLTRESLEKGLLEYAELLQKYSKYSSEEKITQRINELSEMIRTEEELPDVLGQREKIIAQYEAEREELRRLLEYYNRFNWIGLSGKEVRRILMGQMYNEVGLPVLSEDIRERVRYIRSQIESRVLKRELPEKSSADRKRDYGLIQAFTQRELSAITEEINKRITEVTRKTRDFETAVGILQKSYYGLGNSASYYAEMLSVNMQYQEVFNQSLEDLQEVAKTASSAYTTALSRLESFKAGQLKRFMELGMSREEAEEMLQVIEEVSLNAGDINKIGGELGETYAAWKDKLQGISLETLANEYKILKDQVITTRDNWEKVSQAVNDNISKFAELNQQIFELIMSSEKYAGAWQSIKNTIELVKSTTVELYEAQFRLQGIRTTSTTAQKIFGPMWDRSSWVLQQLGSEIQSLFNRYYQLEQARLAYGSNIQLLQQALAEMAPLEERLREAMKSGVTDPLVDASNRTISALTDNTNAVKELTVAMKGETGAGGTLIDNWAVGTEYAEKLATTIGGVLIDNWAAGTKYAEKVAVHTGVTGLSGRENFIKALAPYAQLVAQRTGLHPALVLAQWGLETGWGTSSVFKQGFNLAGIKATGDWRGRVVGVYRAYSNLQEAVEDYIKIVSLPRYREALRATTPQEQARALKAGGWAEDPAYAEKLISLLPDVAKAIGVTLSTLTTETNKAEREYKDAVERVKKLQQEYLESIRRAQDRARIEISYMPANIRRIIKEMSRIEEVFGGVVDTNLVDYVRQKIEAIRNAIFDLGVSTDSVKKSVKELVNLFYEVRLKNLNKELEEEINLRNILATVIPSQARKSSEIFQQHIQKLIDLVAKAPAEKIPALLQEVVKYHEKYLRAQLVEMYKDVFEARNRMLYLRQVAPSFAPGWEQIINNLANNLIKFLEENPGKEEELAPHFRALEEFSSALKYDVSNQIYDLAQAIQRLQSVSFGPEYWQALDNVLQGFERLYTLEEKVENLVRVWREMPFEVPGIYDRLLEQRTLLMTRELNVLFKQIEQVEQAIGNTVPLSMSYFAALEDLIPLYQRENELLEQRVKLTEDLFKYTGRGLEEFLSLSAKRDAYNRSLLNNLRSQVFNRAISGVEEDNQDKYYSLLKELVSLERQWRDILQERIDLLAESFKVGAISLEDYVEKLRVLRDTTYEVRSSIFEFYTGMTGSIESSFAKGLASVLTGSLTAKEDFIGAVKESMAGIFSELFTKVLFNTTGVRQLIEEATLGVAQAVLTGGMIDVDAVRSNFNEILSTLTNYFPVFKQALQGIFETLKDQVYNAPSGFRIEKYLYDYLKARGPEEIPGLAWPTEPTELPPMPAMPTAGTLGEREATSILTNPLREVVDNVFVTLDGLVKRMDENMTSFFGKLGQGFENLFNQILAKFGIQQQLAQAPEAYVADFTKVLSRSVLSQIGELKGGSWVLPARVLGAILGEQVDWDDITKQVVIGGKRFAPIENREGVAWVSLRQVAEALGYTVRWSETNGDVVVSKTISIENNLNRQNNLLTSGNQLLGSLNNSASYQNSLIMGQSQIMNNIYTTESGQYVLLQNVNGQLVALPVQITNGLIQAISNIKPPTVTVNVSGMSYSVSSSGYSYSGSSSSSSSSSYTPGTPEYVINQAIGGMSQAQMIGSAIAMLQKSWSETTDRAAKEWYHQKAEELRQQAASLGISSEVEYWREETWKNFHSGGIAPYETWAVLRRDEMVLPPNLTRQFIDFLGRVDKGFSLVGNTGTSSVIVNEQYSVNVNIEGSVDRSVDIKQAIYEAIKRVQAEKERETRISSLRKYGVSYVF